MKISASDLCTGVYGVMKDNWTAQGPASQAGTGGSVQSESVDAGELVTTETLSPPTGYGSWEAAYQNGLLK